MNKNYTQLMDCIVVGFAAALVKAQRDGKLTHQETVEYTNFASNYSKDLAEQLGLEGLFSDIAEERLADDTVSDLVPTEDLRFN